MRTEWPRYFMGMQPTTIVISLPGLYKREGLVCRYLKLIWSGIRSYVDVPVYCRWKFRLSENLANPPWNEAELGIHSKRGIYMIRVRCYLGAGGRISRSLWWSTASGSQKPKCNSSADFRTRIRYIASREVLHQYYIVLCTLFSFRLLVKFCIL